jgi:nitrate reductase gamma subunit
MNWDELQPATSFLVHQLHYASLAFMIVAYAIKIRQLMKKPLATEGTKPKGDHGAGIRYAYMTLAMPWELESQRKHFVRYLEFALFHVAMAVGIGVAFVMPWAHGAMAHPSVAFALQGVFALGAVIGTSRLLRRLADPAVRAISTPDDYFCIVLLIGWMVSGVLAAPQASELYLVVFFGLATFFLFYVPFSKISHYIYYPFIRFYVGKHFGHRGVWPRQHPTNA